MAFDLDNLRMFLCAVDEGSFSAAARKLRRVPSAVSTAIGNLEAELGLDLFDRAGREPKPTAAAVALLPQARLMLSQFHRLNQHALSLTQGLETALSIAVVPELLATTPWTTALGAVSQAFPLLPIEVLSAPQADALAMAQSGRVQLALVFERYGLSAHENFQEIGKETLVAVVAPTHPMLAALTTGGIRDADLLAHRQIVVAGRDSDYVDKRVALSELQWRTDDPVAALLLVEAGLGWAWLPSGFVRLSVEAGKTVHIPSENFSNVLNFFVDVVWGKDQALGLAAQHLVEQLRGTGR
ncbi:MAG: LysR family transcriptional regulator [Duganella sp.]